MLLAATGMTPAQIAIVCGLKPRTVAKIIAKGPRRREWQHAPDETAEYVPTPEQIAEACLAIQATWTPQQERSRRVMHNTTFLQGLYLRLVRASDAGIGLDDGHSGGGLAGDPEYGYR
jgi:hypothetical protein